MPGDGDRRDRNEATRLFVAAVVALVLLIVVVGGALYFFSGWVESASDPFAAGLGLKNAALISFAVSFVAILIMTVASGGDAIFGELPFTIAGFLIFFVVFWLMIAWIF